MRSKIRKIREWQICMFSLSLSFSLTLLIWRSLSLFISNSSFTSNVFIDDEKEAFGAGNRHSHVGIVPVILCQDFFKLLLPKQSSHRVSVHISFVWYHLFLNVVHDFGCWDRGRWLQMVVQSQCWQHFGCCHVWRGRSLLGESIIRAWIVSHNATAFICVEHLVHLGVFDPWASRNEPFSLCFASSITSCLLFCLLDSRHAGYFFNCAHSLRTAAFASGVFFFFWGPWEWVRSQDYSVSNNCTFLQIVVFFWLSSESLGCVFFCSLCGLCRRPLLACVHRKFSSFVGTTEVFRNLHGIAEYTCNSTFGRALVFFLWIPCLPIRCNRCFSVVVHCRTWFFLPMCVGVWTLLGYLSTSLQTKYIFEVREATQWTGGNRTVALMVAEHHQRTNNHQIDFLAIRPLSSLSVWQHQYIGVEWETSSTNFFAFRDDGKQSFRILYRNHALLPKHLGLADGIQNLVHPWRSFWWSFPSSCSIQSGLVISKGTLGHGNMTRICCFWFLRQTSEASFSCISSSVSHECLSLLPAPSHLKSVAHDSQFESTFFANLMEPRNDFSLMSDSTRRLSKSMIGPLQGCQIRRACGVCPCPRGLGIFAYVALTFCRMCPPLFIESGL